MKPMEVLANPASHPQKQVLTILPHSHQSQHHGEGFLVGSTAHGNLAWGNRTPMTGVSREER